MPISSIAASPPNSISREFLLFPGFDLSRMLEELISRVCYCQLHPPPGDENVSFPTAPYQRCWMCPKTPIPSSELCFMFPEGQRVEDPRIISPEDQRDARISDTNL
ncbi:uncharacterized protein LOC107433977 [Ziziphus jujuba]|uniref:Uncharacterized protein LOC107433977 n=1 Tax=Ziziphus jujuba TaxID=326968 RepID=A0ABM3IPY2_ZIZJJ|nr:uncharacterized protein LOC107433977 [Ziziphus jujuba]